MITCRDPNAMLLAEQLAEIGEILALAYLRLHRKELEQGPAESALCHRAGKRDGAMPAQEAVA